MAVRFVIRPSPPGRPGDQPGRLHRIHWGNLLKLFPDGSYCFWLTVLLLFWICS
jgi:hypothetical protein